MYGAFAAVSTVNAVMLVTVLKAPQVLHGGPDFYPYAEGLRFRRRPTGALG